MRYCLIFRRQNVVMSLKVGSLTLCNLGLTAFSSMPMPDSIAMPYVVSCVKKRSSQTSASINGEKYRKDWELAKRRNLPIEELNDVIYKLANDIPLPKEKKDHALRGNYVGYREYHIKPDWLLIYKKTDNNELQILELARTGTHSDLFKK